MSSSAFVFLQQEELRWRSLVIGIVSTATVYLHIYILITCVIEDDSRRLYWFATSIATKTVINLCVLFLEENKEIRLPYAVLVFLQCQYLYDVHLSYKVERKTDSMLVGRFLLVALECLPLTLFQSYLMIEEEDLTDRRIAGITLSLFTTSFVISEIEPSPDYEVKFRYLLNFAYRLTEIVVFVLGCSLFVYELGNYIFAAISFRYIILVVFSIYNQKTDWLESRLVETIAALCFCICDIGLVLWTAKINSKYISSPDEHYFLMYRSSIESFVKALILQDFFNVATFCVAYFLPNEIDADLLQFVVFPLLCSFCLQHIIVFVAIVTHPHAIQEDKNSLHSDEHSLIWKRHTWSSRPISWSHISQE